MFQSFCRVGKGDVEKMKGGRVYIPAQFSLFLSSENGQKDTENDFCLWFDIFVKIDL